MIDFSLTKEQEEIIEKYRDFSDRYIVPNRLKYDELAEFILDKANAEFWRNKIQTNKERDLDTNKRLKKEGWLVIRAWEHEDPEKVASNIASFLLMY